eukprot:jgi/Mesvir1/19234/Mv01205-RA.5
MALLIPQFTGLRASSPSAGRPIALGRNQIARLQVNALLPGQKGKSDAGSSKPAPKPQAKPAPPPPKPQPAPRAQPAPKPQSQRTTVVVKKTPPPPPPAPVARRSIFGGRSSEEKPKEEPKQARSTIIVSRKSEPEPEKKPATTRGGLFAPKKPVVEEKPAEDAPKPKRGLFGFGGASSVFIEDEEEEEVVVSKPLGSLFGFGKKAEEPAKAAPAKAAGTQIKTAGTQVKVAGTQVVAKKPAGTVALFGAFGRGDPKTVFVAGALGQTGVRVARALLQQGYKVRAGVTDAELAESVLNAAMSLELISSDERKRLTVVPADLSDPESIKAAMKGAGKAAVTLGANEDGPQGSVDVATLQRLVAAANEVRLSKLLVINPTEPARRGGGLFGGGSSVASPASGVETILVDAAVESGLGYTLIQCGSLSAVRDDYAGESNLVISASAPAGAPTPIARVQVASVAALAIEDASNKVLSVTASKTAPEKTVAQLLSELPVDGRKEARVLEAAATEEVQAASSAASSIMGQVSGLQKARAEAAAMKAKADAAAAAAKAKAAALAAKSEELQKEMAEVKTN